MFLVEMGVSADLSGMTIMGGSAATGAGIYSSGRLTVTSSVISGNDGAGVFNSERGTLTVTDSIISDNTGGDGGGMRNDGGTVTLINSTLSGNSAGVSGGGGVWNSGTLTVMNSTLSGNLADWGAGINNHGTVTVVNSTLSGNSAGVNGGGIRNKATLIVTNSTLSGNSAGGEGGGIWNNSTVTLNNSIVAKNAAALGPDIQDSGTLSGYHNLLGDGLGQTALIDGTDGNLVGTASAPIDPLLSDWTRFDDGRWGYYLLSGSPALNAGSNEMAVGPSGQALEEDGYGNARILDSTVDIGSIEGTTPGSFGQTYLVTSLENSIAADGVLTFAEAFEAANANQPVGDAAAGSYSERDVIQFANGLSGTVVVNEEMRVTGDIDIEGPGAAFLIFDGKGLNGVFSIPAYVSVALDGMTITGGSADYGGGIFNAGTLTVTNSTVSDNAAGVFGGGIYVCSGTVTLIDSTLLRNSAAYGGGIFAAGGTLTVTSSTFSGNMTDNYGGAIDNATAGTVIVTNSVFSGNTAGLGGGGINSDGTLVVTSSTFARNSAGEEGGGIRNVGTLTLDNSIVAKNVAPSGPDGYQNDGSAISGSHNLLGNGSGQTALVDGTDGNLVGTALAPIDPLFVINPSDGGDGWGDDSDTADVDESANDNYGDLRLWDESPAVDAGDNALLPVDTYDLDADGDVAEPLPFDLAGDRRVQDGDDDQTATVDMGAYETTAGPMPDRLTLYVDADVSTSGNGLSWSAAYSNPQDALSEAAMRNTDIDPYNDVDQIWIAEGLYTPSAELEPADPRSASFSLLDGVSLYGGFAGTESTLAERDISAHVTTLSGELGTVDDTFDNAYTVVYCGLSIEASLDGLSITGAVADGSDIEGHKERNHGGGIFLNGGTLTLTNSTVSDNSASYGGAIHSASGSVLTLVNSTIANNTATGGGAINNDSLLTMTDSVLSGNSATGENGGGIRNYGTVMIADCTLSGNSANLGGGAVYNRRDYALNVTGSTLSGNSAGYGGAIGSWSVVSLLECELDSNTAANGGAVFCEGIFSAESSVFSNNSATQHDGGAAELHGEASLVDCQIVGNSSQELGGGIYQWYGSLSIVGSTFSENFAAGDGGGIACDGLDATLTVELSTFEQNTAEAAGGGISARWGTLLLTECEMQNNAADVQGGAVFCDGTFTAESSVFSGNSGRQYGGGAAKLYGDTTLTNCEFLGNTSEEVGGAINLGSGTLTLTDSTFSENSAVSAGGGIAAWGTVSFLECELQNNVAANGGAVFCDGTLTAEASIFSDNSTSLYGGGAAELCGEATFVDCEMVGNAASSGGAFYNYAKLTLMDCTLSENESTGGGGAIWNNGGDLELNACVVSSNFSPASGGALFNSGNGTLTVANSTLSDNSAISGGAIRNDGGMLAVTESYLLGNSASWGGGINNGGTVILTDSVLSRNSAEGDGGGIRNEQGAMTVTNSILSMNSASWGGGIWSNGTLTVTKSTFSGNSANGGGGIANHSMLTVANSTFSGNSAEWDGGGIRNEGGTVTVTDGTLSGNVAGSGGGIWNNNTLTLNNSIVAKNTASTGPDIQNYGTLSGSHNLLGDGSGQSALVHGQDGNLVGTTENPIDPLFTRNPSDGGDGWGNDPDTPDIDESANDDYGDLGLQEGSPAIDAGSNALLPADEFDLDGDGDTAEPIPVDVIGNFRVCDGDGDETETVDMGAREFYRYPIGIDDTFEIASDEVLAIPGSDLTANDLSAPGMTLQVVGVTPPTGLPGTLDFDGETVTFTPEAGFTGTAWFDYTVESSSGNRSTGTVTVHVVPIPGDLNLDGQVNSRDLDIIRAWWGMEVEPGSLMQGDPSGDGRVGSADLDLVRANWGRTASAAAPLVQDDRLQDSALAQLYGPPEQDDTDRDADSSGAATTANAAEKTWVRALQAMDSTRKPESTPVMHRAAVDLILTGMAR